MRSRGNTPEQLTLPLSRGWGGARSGAGRRPSPGRRSMPHRKRGLRFKNQPLHVTMCSLVRPLRSRFVFPTVREAIAKANRQQSGAFRVCEFSVQEDHIHLLVEATTPLALARGMRGLALRIALALNRL